MYCKLIVTTFFLTLSMHLSAQNVMHKKVLRIMGSRFEFTAISNDSVLALQAIDAAIEESKRIEKLLSEWDENALIYSVNLEAWKKPVHIDPEVYHLINRCIKISELTHGVFDISCIPLLNVWKFDGSMNILPKESLIESTLSRVSYKNIVLSEPDTTIFFKKDSMMIGFGAIGKGYAAQQSKLIMQKVGIESGVISAGGDLTTWGTSPEGNGWRIDIANPENPDESKAWLKLSDLAIVTSGNYERRIIIDGKTYSHIIDPRTGYPAMGLKSVTVICESAELADALATSLFVLGKDDGSSFAEKLNGVEAIFIDDNNKMFSTSGVKLNFEN